MWLAAVTIILLLTSELLYYSPEYSSRVVINKKLLRSLAIVCGLAFAVMVIMHVVQIFKKNYYSTSVPVIVMSKLKFVISVTDSDTVKVNVASIVWSTPSVVFSTFP
jgi:hypothetical protein